MIQESHGQLLRGEGNNAPVVLITGDTHRSFNRIVRFCGCFPTTKDDVVLSHTTPYQYRPTDLFIPGLDQSTVDSSTEKWLRDIEERLVYEKWYAGHFHCDRKTDKMEIMYRDVELFCCDRELGFSME